MAAGDTSSTDSGSSSDEDATYLSAIASVAVSGTTISANAADSAKAAADKLSSCFRDSRSTSGANRFQGNGDAQAAAYLTMAQTAPEEEKPLQGPLADKLAEQLHNILERTVGRSLDASPPSSSEDDDDVEAAEGNSESDGDTLDAPMAAPAATVDVGVRMFKTVEEGTPCIFIPSTGRTLGTGTRPYEATTWSGRLLGRAGDGSDEEEEVLREAWTVAVDPEDLLTAASAAARAAVENICPVVEEADSDTDWRGGVKPGSSIEQRRAAKGSGGGGSTGAAPAAKRKRKGKTERLKEAQRKAEQAATAGGSGGGGDGHGDDDAVVGGSGGPSRDGAAADGGADEAAAEAEEEARRKAERKREKRRDIKKQRRLSARAGELGPHQGRAAVETR